MSGPRGVFGAAGAVLILAALVIALGVKIREAEAPTA